MRRKSSFCWILFPTLLSCGSSNLTGDPSDESEDAVLADQGGEADPEADEPDGEGAEGDEGEESDCPRDWIPLVVMEGCGDSILQEGEECDDGNRLDGDGCTWDCKIGDGTGSEPVPSPLTRSVRVEGPYYLYEFPPEEMIYGIPYYSHEFIPVCRLSHAIECDFRRIFNLYPTGDGYRLLLHHCRLEGSGADLDYWAGISLFRFGEGGAGFEKLWEEELSDGAGGERLNTELSRREGDEISIFLGGTFPNFSDVVAGIYLERIGLDGAVLLPPGAVEEFRHGDKEFYDEFFSVYPFDWGYIFQINSFDLASDAYFFKFVKTDREGNLLDACPSRVFTDGRSMISSMGERVGSSSALGFPSAQYCMALLDDIPRDEFLVSSLSSDGFGGKYHDFFHPAGSLVSYFYSGDGDYLFMVFDLSMNLAGPPRSLMSIGWEDSDYMESFREARGDGLWGVIISNTETFILVDDEGRIIGDPVELSSIVDCDAAVGYCWTESAAIAWDGEKFVVLTLNYDGVNLRQITVLLWNVFVE